MGVVPVSSCTHAAHDRHASAAVDVVGCMQVEWPHDELSTLDADAFYRQVLRTGIRYGPHFRMLLRKTTDGSAAVLRCAALRAWTAG